MCCEKALMYFNWVINENNDLHIVAPLSYCLSIGIHPALLQFWLVMPIGTHLAGNVCLVLKQDLGQNM